MTTHQEHLIETAVTYNHNDTHNTAHTHSHTTKAPYADALKNGKPTNHPVILIAPKEKMDSTEALTILKLAINRIEDKINIIDVNLSSRGKVFLKATEADLKKIKNIVNRKLDETFTSTILTWKNPYLILLGVPVHTDATDICKNQCESQNLSVDNLKFKFTIPSRRNPAKKSIIIEASPTCHRLMMNQRFWLDGLNKYSVDNFLPIKRCTKCQRFGHNAGKCLDEPRCGKCAGRHETKACSSISIRCPNCINKHNKNDAHECNSFQCDVYQQVREHIISITNYG